MSSPTMSRFSTLRYLFQSCRRSESVWAAYIFFSKAYATNSPFQFGSVSFQIFHYAARGGGGTTEKWQSAGFRRLVSGMH